MKLQVEAGASSIQLCEFCVSCRAYIWLRDLLECEFEIVLDVGILIFSERARIAM